MPPDKPEALEAGMEIEDYAEAEWEKQITGGIGHIGFGMKGHWIIFIGVIPWDFLFQIIN